MHIESIVFQGLAVSLVASTPPVTQEKAVGQRSAESSATTPTVLVARQSRTDLGNNPQPPASIQYFFR
ncbi:uncharacterized protein PgNI_08924 [Pyricularia grisea]|uniref:Uncharacterized protein n=1 Tax=Pyricularia grisea TaxID=148305 RepID=A0A6P8AUC0_PYRGI|nr:uncharacterized protein PgNI_08924 [Pyricularia grisea]TLD05759.1 hypothetical protein PgNI_08924 [Pyricularia grisea]